MRFKERFLAEEPGQAQRSGDELKSSKDLGFFGLIIGTSPFSWSVKGDMKFNTRHKTKIFSLNVIYIFISVNKCNR